METGDICSFYLEPHDRRPLPSFMPGQYLTFRLNIPGQAKPVIRCYSLSDGPKAEYFRVTIKKVGPPPGKADGKPGLVSSHFHDQIEQGDIVDVKAPGGQFFLDPAEDTPAVLIGGGIGLTPGYEHAQCAGRCAQPAQCLVLLWAAPPRRACHG